MAKRTTFYVIDPTGKEHTRTSDSRTYSHAVLVLSPDYNPVTGNCDSEPTWGVRSWVGRPDLVAGQVRQAEARSFNKEVLAVPALIK